MKVNGINIPDKKIPINKMFTERNFGSKEMVAYRRVAPSRPCIFLPQTGHWYTAFPRPSAHTLVIVAIS
jgi:hypothetical protein